MTQCHAWVEVIKPNGPFSNVTIAWNLSKKIKFWLKVKNFFFGHVSARKIVIIRWGGGGWIFKKKNWKNCRPFFKSIKLIFPSSSKALRRLCFGHNFCAAGKIMKKQAKKGVFTHFFENFDQKVAFFCALLSQH